MNDYLVTDLDGTLYFDDVESLDELLFKMSSKYKVVLATGRHLEDFDLYFSEKIKKYFEFMVFLNGAIVVKNNKTYYNTIDREIVEKIKIQQWIRGMVVYELTDGNRVEECLLRECNYGDVLRIHAYTNEMSDDYVWNINVANALGMQIYTDSIRHLVLYSKQVNKYIISNRFINSDNGKMVKVIGNGLNDLSLMVNIKNSEMLFLNDLDKCEAVRLIEEFI